MDDIPAASGPDRMPPLSAEAMTPAQRQAAETLASGPRGSLRGPFISMLRSPEFMNRVQKVGEYLRYESGLPGDLRELAILIIARRWSQIIEWSIHAPIALAEGLPREAFADLAAGRRPSSLSPTAALVHDYCVELQQTRGVGDETYARIVEALGEAQLIELTGLCGYYAMLAMIMNVARTPMLGDEQPFAVPS